MALLQLTGVRRSILLSIRPEYASAVIVGRKKFEYRRCKVGIREGDFVLLYESAPKCRIVGAFTAGRIVVGVPSDLLTLEPDQEIRDRVAQYLNGARIASAIEIKAIKVHPVGMPLSVVELRHPPQSYCFLSEELDGRIYDLSEGLEEPDKRD